MTVAATRVSLAGGLALSVARPHPEAGPPVVLLPGPTDSWWSYVPVLDRLPATIDAIALSPRGHGDSDTPATGYAVEDFATDVVDLLDALAIERAVLVAHSGSGLVARRVAVDHPARVAGLLLEATPTTLRGVGAFADLLTTVAGLSDPIDPAFARSFVADTSTAQLPAALVERLVAEVRKVPAHVWQEMFGALGAADDRARLDAIRAPTRLVWGDADPLVGRAMQEELRAAIRTCELTVYPGVGHTPRWEDPERFAVDVVTSAT